MEPGRGSRVAQILLAVCLAGPGLSALRGTPVAGAAPDCASFEQAANFAVFSNGAFDSSASAGTSIAGRIAAAGDVTLDGVSVGPAAGDASPEVIAGRNFTGGRTTGAGGTVNGGVTYGGASDVAPNFTVNGGLVQAAPPFAFDSEFVSLKTLSSSLGGLQQSSGATVVLQPWAELDLTGTASGLNVFTVSAAQLAQAQGVVINLTQPGATALINVTTDTQLTIAPMYMNLSGVATDAGILWNLPLATRLAVNHGVAWHGSILAPNATVTTSGRPQLYGQLMAADVPSSDWVINRVKYTGCLPPAPTPPDHTLTLVPLCIDSAGDLNMRLRNTGDQSRAVTWRDLTGRDSGAFVVPAHSDQFFLDQGGSGASVVSATSGTTTVRANGTDARCQGSITVQLVVQGEAPAGQTWAVRVTDGENGNVSQVLTLGAGQSSSVTVAGGYVPGSAPIDGVVGGVLYTTSVDDPKGADSTTISLNPVEILDGQDELVVVTLVYTSESGSGVGPPVPIEPDQPTLPPEAPDPAPGPGLVPATSGADLAISQSITPGRVPVRGIVDTVTVIRNLGDADAVGAVAREIPRFRAARANTVAHVLSLTATTGTCGRIRPVRCSLGTIAPGATVTIRTRTRILVEARLTSTVTVSSQTPETNTTNNTGSATVTATPRRASIRAGISAPPTGHVARRLIYEVSVRSGGPGTANTVRLCTRPPTGFVQVRAARTFRFRGLYCRDFGHVAAGRSVSFRVSGFPSRTGRLRAAARATAVGVARPSHVSAPIDVAAPAVACPASARARRPGAAPTAHAAC
jgi:choice-of-anchor A domain-containing protein